MFGWVRWRSGWVKLGHRSKVWGKTAIGGGQVRSRSQLRIMGKVARNTSKWVKGRNEVKVTGGGQVRSS